MLTTDRRLRIGSCGHYKSNRTPTERNPRRPIEACVDYKPDRMLATKTIAWRLRTESYAGLHDRASFSYRGVDPWL
jgi:hypothetical protein